MSEIRAPDTFPVPYPVIALLLKQRAITLFLGAAASLVKAAPSQLPDGRQLTSDLAKLASYPGKETDPLTKVSQYLVEYAGGRDLILDYINSRFHDVIPNDYRCALTEFLSQIPSRYIPRLIVSTNYDTLIERLLERLSIPYLCISHVLGRWKFTGRLIVYEKLGVFSKNDILTRAEAEELLQDRLADGHEPIILYKMHGSAVSYVYGYLARVARRASHAHNLDIQGFLTDLDVSVTAVLSNNDTAFADFASTVLGPLPTPEATAKLRRALSDWHLPYHTLVRVALSALPWGPARGDGLGLNFNRITGLDIGPPPTYMIEENIRPAAAPVRYPFLWNSPVQDKTEWAGFTDNGDDILALARNVCEVFGIFAVFHPKKDGRKPFGIDYQANNSANIPNLKKFKDLVRKLGPPRWPWAVDQALASAGKAIYARPAAQGGCVECHGISPGRTRLLFRRTWRTPVLDVGTDTKQYEELDWTAQTGVLNGARIPFLVSRLQPNDKSNNVQTRTVTGTVLQHYFPLNLPFAVTARRQAQPPSTSSAMRSNARQLTGTPAEKRALLEYLKIL